MIKNRIGDFIDIDWKNDLFALQPDNVKLPYNVEHLKKSILKHGFSFPFAVWSDNGKYYTIDGHTRKDALIELVAEGVEVPAKLKAFEIKAKDRNEAVTILVEVFNQKHNPFAEEILIEWLQTEDVDVEELNMDSVNLSKDNSISLSDEFGEGFSLPDGDKAPFQQMTFTLADEQAEQIKNAIADMKQTEEYKYAETMGNENSNGNALYLIVMQWAEQRKY